MTYDSFVLETQTDRVGVNPGGGYVSSWQSYDVDSHEWKDVLYVGSELKRSGIPILFPYFGKSEGLPQHGFARKSIWHVTSYEETECIMTLGSSDLSEEYRAWYPYSFNSHIRIRILDSGRIEYCLRVENLGDLSLPIVPGNHPYWQIPHDSKKFIHVDGVSGFDASSIDWTQAPPDSRFNFHNDASVVFPDRTIEIKDLSGTVKYLVVWSLTPLRDPDFNFVCIEPVCGYNNDFEKAPIMVAPHTQWSMQLQFHVAFT